VVTKAPSQGTPALPIHDIKRWMLFGPAKEQYLYERTPSGTSTGARRVSREVAFEKYLRAIASELPGTEKTVKRSILFPAIEDKDTRDRYLGAIKKGFPDARVLSEPEMVVEYFRLVRRSLELAADRNTVVLVLDLGASTTNATIIISNRGAVTTAETGRQRPGHLQAIQGTCGEFAGQWVDEWLADHLGIELPGEDNPSSRHQVLHSIEAAKVQASLTGAAVAVNVAGSDRQWTLETEALDSAAGEVAKRLEPALNKLGERLWSHIHKTDYAREIFAETLRDKSVAHGKDALRLVDYVILAGGTSRLPGLPEWLEAKFSAPLPRFLEVGDDFPLAAAVGALAHVHHDKYSPSRLTAAEPDSGVVLDGGLDVDILFYHKPESKRGQRTSKVERSEVAIRSGDPIVYTGGELKGAFGVNSTRGDSLKARLAPGGPDKSMRQSRKPQTIAVTKPNPVFDVVVNSDGKFTLHSDGVSGLNQLWLDLKTLDRFADQNAKTAEREIPAGAIYFEAADEVVIDVGMSKTVVVAATSGVLDPTDLERHPGANRPTPASNAPPVTEVSEAPIAARIPLLAGDLPERPALDTPPRESERSTPRPSLGESKSKRDASELRAATPLGEPAPTTKAPATDVAADLQKKDHIPRTNEGFIEALGEFIQQAEKRGFDIPKADLLMTLLGLSVRPFVLLAGAPGCGKSTIARMVAHLLSRRTGETFHDVPVQAHWTSDAPLFGSEGLLAPLLEGHPKTHLVLFDEMNLTRPEYYLTRLFHAVESSEKGKPRAAGALEIAPTLAIGTLNIDDTSRPPSAKVLDRCFLVEVDQVAQDRWQGAKSIDGFEGLPTLPGLLDCPDKHGPVTQENLSELLKNIETAVKRDGLREDLLPSRRVLMDLGALLQLHKSFGEAGSAILPESELVDRLIASRVLVKISGPFEQVEPVVKVAEEYCKDKSKDLPRSWRRLKLARKQAELGFVSPWQ
jgi:energy-coupling factor transporter ATP-binding protein EcfA2